MKSFVRSRQGCSSKFLTRQEQIKFQSKRLKRYYADARLCEPEKHKVIYFCGSGKPKETVLPSPESGELCIANVIWFLFDLKRNVPNLDSGVFFLSTGKHKFTFCSNKKVDIDGTIHSNPYMSGKAKKENDKLETARKRKNQVSARVWLREYD